MLKDILQSVGLNTRESELYLACLKVGTQPLKIIEQEVNIDHEEALITVLSLVEKGFVTEFQVKNQSYYTPQNPDMVFQKLQKDQQAQAKNVKKFGASISQFLKFSDPSVPRPEIQFFQDKKGLMEAYEDTLTSKTEILGMISVRDIETVLPDYIPKYYKRRKAANIPIKALFADSDLARQRQHEDKNELRESRILPAELLEDFHIELNIYDDKVAYFSVKEHVAIIVKSKMIADSMRMMFQFCWSFAEGYEANKDK